MPARPGSYLKLWRCEDGRIPPIYMGPFLSDNDDEEAKTMMACLIKLKVKLRFTTIEVCRVTVDVVESVKAL